jgi:trigger factor
VSTTAMAVKVEDVSAVKKRLSFDIPWHDVKEELDAVYREVGRTSRIKGFRKGKIPRSVLEAYFKENVETETTANLVNKFYWEAIKEKDINVVAKPEIDECKIENDKNFSFVATVEVEPLIDPKDYIGLELEKEEREVTDADIDAKLQEMRDMFSTMEDVPEDHTVAKGNQVLIDFEGFIDGLPSEELKAENYQLEIGSGLFVGNFEDQLIGWKKGETRDINVRIPDDYDVADVAGKEVTFKVSLKNIREKKLPELDESFIKNFEKYESLDELKKSIRESLGEENKNKSEVALKERIIDKLLENNEFDVPLSLVDRQVNYMVSDAHRRMIMGGMIPQDASELSLKLRENFTKGATRTVKYVMLLKSIAKKEDVSVDEKEFDDYIQEISRGRVQDYEALKKTIENEDVAENLKNELLIKKIFAFIEKNANINLKK